MIPRYSRPVMRQIWDDENRFKIWFEIEAHAADGMAIVTPFKNPSPMPVPPAIVSQNAESRQQT